MADLGVYLELARGTALEEVVENEQAVHNVSCTECRKNRSERIVDGQYVSDGAPGRKRQDNLPREAELRQRVEERLEYPGIRRLVDGRDDDHATSPLDEPERVAQGRRVAPAVQQILGREVSDVQGLDLEPAAGDLLANVRREGLRTRRSRRAAADRDDEGHG